MATFILILFLGLISFVLAPWIGYLNHQTLHRTDAMAGDEGE
jgi:hypothetical protein